MTQLKLVPHTHAEKILDAHLQRTEVKQAVLRLVRPVDMSAAPVGLTSGWLVALFMSVFLPILPTILMAAAPKLLSNPKFVTILQTARQVLDTILGASEQ